MIGNALGHYQISNLIGKGGMGEVYQAKDQKLGRDVAIKVLPEEFARDSDRVARFQREAKLLASLNHPNIAAIYGLEESGGTNFLVLELVEGQTLADRIKAGPIPVEESLKLALQIAEALEAAHEKGVIHRDLKPANIKVTTDGKVKVLDFGLAKAFAGDQEQVNLSNSPTLSDAATQQGVILGTAGYMSPEQARGKAVDKRADIWAFGCVLYEILTGGVAFQGDDVSEILASVIKGDVKLDLLPANIHPKVREAINRCLQKDLRKRYSGIADARYEIEQALADSGGLLVEPITAAKSRMRLGTLLAWLTAAVVLGAIVAGWAVWRLKPREPRPIVRFSFPLPADLSLITDYLIQSIAISPDGSRFVCATNKGLYLRSMDLFQGRIIPGTEGQVGVPFFSPDGQWIGFWSGRDKQLRKIPVSGGSPLIICDMERVNNASWSADNVILFGGDSTQIMKVPADGGTPEKILEGKNEVYFAPQLLPDRTNLLLTLAPATRILDMRIAVQSLGSGTPKELFAGRTAQYLDSGHLVYIKGRDLFAVPFDGDRLRATGGHVSMVQGLATGQSQYAVSNSGSLVYVQSSEERTLVWVDRNGKEEAIDAPPRAYAYAHLSPDGTRVALDIRNPENDIWIWDLARKRLTPLTRDPEANWGGIWTPDGKNVAFSAERNGAANIWLQAADGSGSPEPLTQIPKCQFLAHAFLNGDKQLLITEIATLMSVKLLSMGTNAAPKHLLGGQFNAGNPQISPDGRWMAYQSNESGQDEIYVRPFPDVTAGRFQVSREGGTRPLWNPNGHELFYFLPPGTLMSVPVETGTNFQAGDPRVLFKGEYPAIYSGTQYSVTRDGRRFLMIKDFTTKPGSASPPQQINVVLNWTEELKQRVQTK